MWLTLSVTYFSPKQPNHIQIRPARHYIKHKIDCKTPNLIYYIYCDCQFPSDYVGSTKNIEHRWSKHKGDIRNGNWTACVLTRHFGENHSNNIEEAIGNIKVTLVDCSENEENLKLLQDRWILKMGTLFTGLNSHNEVLSNRTGNYGKSQEGLICNLYVTTGCS